MQPTDGPAAADDNCNLRREIGAPDPEDCILTPTTSPGRWRPWRPRLLLAAVAGLATWPLLPAHWPAITQALVAWNVAVWLYVVLMAFFFARADHARLRRTAQAHAEGAAMVLATALAAAVASLVGVVVQFAQAHQPGTAHALPHILLALSTVAGAWLLMPTLFTLSYASRYYAPRRGHPSGGMAFPHADARFEPAYEDFLYFAYTIAVAAQTSDVAVTTRPMRRLVALQSVQAFVFNTAILALGINLAASLV